MKQKAPLRQPIKKSNRPPLEDLDAASTSLVLEMLHAPNDLYWHHRIKNLFADVGLATRRIEHEPHHPVWRVWLTREHFALAPDNDTAIKQLRKILRDGGLKVVNKELNVIDRRGDKFVIVFLLDIGSPGIVYRRPPQVGQGKLWAESV